MGRYTHVVLQPRVLQRRTLSGTSLLFSWCARAPLAGGDDGRPAVDMVLAFNGGGGRRRRRRVGHGRRMVSPERDQAVLSVWESKLLQVRFGGSSERKENRALRRIVGSLAAISAAAVPAWVRRRRGAHCPAAGRHASRCAQGNSGRFFLFPALCSFVARSRHSNFGQAMEKSVGARQRGEKEKETRSLSGRAESSRERCWTQIPQRLTTDELHSRRAGTYVSRLQRQAQIIHTLGWRFPGRDAGREARKLPLC